MAEERSKTVHDAVHGSLDIGGVFLELLDSPQFQRLHGIRQLGLAHLVFPGAHHSRLEHSLGAWHVGTLMANNMGLREGLEELRAACLLHDIGHPPYSHTLEGVLQEKLGEDHERITGQVIRGERDILGKGEAFPGQPSIPEILEDHGLSPGEVASLIDAGGGPGPDEVLERFSRRPGRAPERVRPRAILHGPLDADQVDYLLRDARYTGVAYGVIDLPRIVRTVALRGGRLVVRKSGLPAVESMLVARALMYSSVYFHRTVRIAEMMLARAVERLEDLAGAGIMTMVDAELMACLASRGGFPAEMARRLKYRRLFKKAYSVGTAGITDEQVRRLSELDSPSCRRQVEGEIARRAGAPEGFVIVDFPSKEVLLSEPRMHETDVMILDEERDRLQPLSKHSPLARALQQRAVPDWAVMVSTDARSRESVAAAAKRVLG